MQYLNEKLWKSAYLIEFHKNGVLQDAFTFSVPPQNEEFVFSQRINETKTFGGSVFDDYGNDTVKISLSGTTINQSLKIIYQSSKGQKTLSGQDEIFYLRDLLKKYGDYNNLEGKEVYLYALDSGKRNKGGKNQKAWQIFVGDLTIKRSKDMPFTYYYTLNASGCDIDKSSKNKLLKLVEKNKTYNDIISKFNNFTGYLNKGIEFISDKLSYIDEFTEIYSVIEKNVSEVANNLSAYSSLSVGAINSITNLINETVSLQDSVYENVVKLMPQSIGVQLYGSVGNLVDSCVSMGEWWRSFTNGTEFDKVCSKYQVAKQELSDKFLKAMKKTSKSCNEFSVAVKKELSTNKQVLVVPGSENTNDNVIIANGYKENIVKESDTWASLSNSFYGTPEYATVLQMYNNIASEELVPGKIIFIPNISSNSTPQMELNEVYHDPTIKDIYGVDIKIINGDFYYQNGDVAAIKGISNLNQAILNRLTTTINSRIRNVVYGIRNETGVPSVSASAISSYITTSIEQTILADPRVENIESLEWNSANGDNVQVNVTYRTSVGAIENLKTII